MVKLKPIVFTFFMFIGCITSLYAAFPIKKITTNESKPTLNNDADNIINNGQIAHRSFFSKILHIHDKGNYHYKERRPRKLSTAIILNALGFFTGLLGLHRLYLGYTMEGVLQLSGGIAFELGVLAIFFIDVFSIFETVTIPFYIYFLFAYAGVMAIWQIIDLIRLAIGDLKPKNGNYQNSGRNNHSKYIHHYN